MQNADPATIAEMTTAQLETRREYLLTNQPGECMDERRALAIELAYRADKAEYEAHQINDAMNGKQGPARCTAASTANRLAELYDQLNGLAAEVAIESPKHLGADPRGLNDQLHAALAEVRRARRIADAYWRDAQNDN